MHVFILAPRGSLTLMKSASRNMGKYGGESACILRVGISLHTYVLDSRTPVLREACHSYKNEWMYVAEHLKLCFIIVQLTLFYSHHI